MKKSWLVLRQWLITTTVFFLSINSIAQYRDFSANAEFEYRYFFNEGLDPQQHQSYLSFAFEPEFIFEDESGNNAFVFKAFARWSQHDSRRTHADIRELYWQRFSSNWELNIGLKKIYWGVTESAHLVDIINQTDALEGFDGEKKLGQPMVQFTYLLNWGTWEAFLLPYHRKRIFPGPEGRLRPTFPVNDRDPVYEKENQEFRPGFALRWSNSMGVFDIGVSEFYGTAREPLFVTEDSNTFDTFYPLINQVGLDLQATTGSWLWKFEGIRRTSNPQDMTAIATGVEYTIGNVFGKGLDIGLLAEYLYDSRDELAFSGLQNDIFVGTRWALNDTQSSELLAGMIVDIEHGSRIFSVEGSRRIGESWKVELESRIFSNISSKEFIYLIREDSFIEFSLFKYF